MVCLDGILVFLFSGNALRFRLVDNLLFCRYSLKGSYRNCGL